jgi:hypothetical protein
MNEERDRLIRDAEEHVTKLLAATELVDKAWHAHEAAVFYGLALRAADRSE